MQLWGPTYPIIYQAATMRCRIILSVENDSIKVTRNGLENVIGTAKTLDSLMELLNTVLVQSAGELDILCSSSLDFPEEFTNDQQVIQLCNAIRS